MYPALAVTEAIIQHSPDTRVSFIGTRGGFERPLVEQARLPFEAYHEVWGGPIVGINPLRAVVNGLKLLLGTLQALGLMLRHRPHGLLLTGGYAGLPVAVAAWLLRVPSLIYLPDVEPGSSIRFLQRFTRRVAVTVPDSTAYFPQGKSVVTGYPVRLTLAQTALDGQARQKALDFFKLDPNRKTLLVFGGSRGTRSINLALMDALPQLTAHEAQVIHITGTLDWERVNSEKNKLAAEVMTYYHVYPYLHDEMALAFAAADLAVCRAGASVLGESPLFALPSILVPYPYAWRYQKVNADYLAVRGAAVRLNDETLSADLLPTLLSLLQDPARLAEMRAKAGALAQPDGAWQVGRELLRLAGGE